MRLSEAAGLGGGTALQPESQIFNFLGFKLPFDRHDWIVDRCGVDVRYVIDFYNAKSADPRSPIAMHLDARPALDSSSVWDGVYVQGAWTLSASGSGVDGWPIS